MLRACREFQLKTNSRHWVVDQTLSLVPGVTFIVQIKSSSLARTIMDWVQKVPIFRYPFDCNHCSAFILQIHLPGSAVFHRML